MSRVVTVPDATRINDVLPSLIRLEMQLHPTCTALFVVQRIQLLGAAHSQTPFFPGKCILFIDHTDYYPRNLFKGSV